MGLAKTSSMSAFGQTVRDQSQSIASWCGFKLQFCQKGLSFILILYFELLSNVVLCVDLQVESPIICPLLQKMDENGIFEVDDL